MKQLPLVAALLSASLVHGNTVVLNAFASPDCTGTFFVCDLNFTPATGNLLPGPTFPNGATANSYVAVNFDGALKVFACQQGFPCANGGGLALELLNSPVTCQNVGFNSDKIAVNTGQLQSG
jgi:hypothetical protein